MKLVIIDLDSIGFILAGGPIFRDLQRDERADAFMAKNIKDFINSIFKATNADKYLGFYQGKGHENYRKVFNPDYKSHREKPEFMVVWGDFIKETLSEYPGFVGLKYIESDDALNIMHKTLKGYQIIWSHNDKDLKCIPGTHYNYKTNVFYDITEEEALINGYAQTISGDATDGVPGIYGIGPAKATKFLKKNDMKFVAAFKEAYYSAKVIPDVSWRRLFWMTYHSIRLLNSLDEYRRFLDKEEVPLDRITDVIAVQQRPNLDHW